MAPVTIASNRRGWREASSTAFWTARVLWDTGSTLYAVVQDTGASPRVRVLKADQYPIPSSWSEQDSANNTSVASVDYPFDSYYDGSRYIHITAFSATNTLTHYRFDTQTDSWTTAFGDGSTAADNTQSVRVTWQADNGMVRLFHTSSNDDADLIMNRCTSAGSWTSGTTMLAKNDDDASALLDYVANGTNRGLLVAFEAGDDDVRAQSVESTNTLGTAQDLTTSGPTASSAFAAGARYTPFLDTSDSFVKVIVAYPTSTGTLVERVVRLDGALSSGRVASQVTIEGTAADVGTRTAISTARLGSTDYCAWWDDASSGTIYYATESGGSWTRTTFKTGITMLIEIVPVADGLAAVYQQGNDVVMDFIVPVSVNGSVAAGSLAVAGQAVAGRTGGIGAVATGGQTVAGQTVSGIVSATGSVSTGSLAVSGQTVGGTAGGRGAIAAGSHAVSGQAVAASGGAVGQVGTGSLAVSGQAVEGSATSGATGEVVTGAHAITGQTVQASSGSVANVGAGSLAVAGQTVQGTAASTAAVATGSHTVAGQAIAAQTGSTGNVTNGSLAVDGQTVQAVSGIVASIGTGDYAVDGQLVAGEAGTVGVIATGQASITGGDVAGVAGTVGTIGTTSYAISGQAIEGTAGVADQETGTVATGTLAVSGQAIAGTAGTTGSIDTSVIVVTPRAMLGVAGTVGVVGSGALEVAGQAVEGIVSVPGVVVTGELPVTGGSVAATAGTVALIDAGAMQVEGQTIAALFEMASAPSGAIWNPLASPSVHMTRQRLGATFSSAGPNATWSKR